MDINKLNPWNWFKHEESVSGSGSRVPVKRAANEQQMPTLEQSFYNPVQQLHQEIDSLFDDALRGFNFPSLRSRLPESGNSWTIQSFRPSLNVSSDNRCYEVTLEAPGMTERDLSIELSGDILTIQGEKQEEKEDKDRHFYRIERSYGNFQRTLSLPDDANVEEIQANMKDGVLKLMIPRREVVDSETRKISINP